MQYAYEILSVLGDYKPHFKEEIYPLVQLTAGRHHQYLKQVINIDKQFKKYLEYLLVSRGKSQNISIKGQTLEVKGHETYQLTDKGLKALDYYRSLAGGKDLSKGDLYGSDENFNQSLGKRRI